MRPVTSFQIIFYCFIAAGFSDCKSPSPKFEKKETDIVRKIGRIVADVQPAAIHAITSANAPAKPAKIYPTVTIDNSSGGIPSFQYYGTESGLSITAVNNGIVDKMGNLWFSTNGGGVSRFDGMGFTTFTTANGVGSNAVWCISNDHAGNIWLGTNGSGLTKYDGYRFINYGKSHGLTDNIVTALFEDSRETLWIGTNTGGITLLSGNKLAGFKLNNLLPKASVSFITEVNSGNIWIGLKGEGVGVFDGTHLTTYKLGNKNADQVNSIHAFKNGKVWLGTNDGIFSFTNGLFERVKIDSTIPNTYVSNFLEDKSGNIWYTTLRNGIVKFDGSRYVNFNKTNGLPSDLASFAVEDNSGCIWFGLPTVGLIKYNNNGVLSLGSQQGLPESVVWNILKDHNGNFWFAYRGRGLVKYDGKTFSNYTREQGLPDNELHGVAEDRSGRIWVASEKGASCLENGNIINYNKSQGLPYDDIWSMCVTSDNSIWFGTNGGGAARFDGKRFICYSTLQGLPGNVIYCILESTKGNIWFATHGGGVSCWDGQHFKNYDTRDGLAGNSVYSISEDRAGNIWFGTDGHGASKFDGRMFTNYTVGEGLGDNVVYAITSDKLTGDTWLGTNQGLSRYKDDLKGSYSIQNFNIKSGYPVKDLNVNAFYLDSNTIWGGCGDNRVIKFNYQQGRKKSSALNVFIKSVQVNNEDICWNCLKKRTGNSLDSLAILNESTTLFSKELSVTESDSIRSSMGEIAFKDIGRYQSIPLDLVLPYKDNTITFDFGVTGTVIPEQIKFQYKLEGQDEDWSKPDGDRSAVFGNLREGSYNLKLRAIENDGGLAEVHYSFKVLPPWQRTWLAYGLYLIVFILLGYAAFKFVKRRILSQQLAKEKEVQLQHAVEIEKAYKELKATQTQLIHAEKMASLGQLTAGIAHEIQNPLNFVNNFSDVNQEMIDELQAELQSGNTDQAIAISNDIKENEIKINHHGKRADAIVKGMLQHSRLSAGIKEPTDINALCDEYMHSSYTRFRAKDSLFNATLTTDFDQSIGSINVVPHDLGSVLLNVFSNALYATNEKKKTADRNYQPAVSVKTKKINNKVQIEISDNGNGVPLSLKDKIFQPFFTTKPTGQGTGLGLSLAYDIVNAHGGEISVESKDGAGSVFIIIIPC